MNPRHPRNQRFEMVALPFFTKVVFSGFSLGIHQKIAVVANDGFSLRAGNMAG